MKKVLIILPSLAVGGMERVLINLVNQLDSNKYNITIKTIYDCFELADNLNNNIKYSSFYKSPKNNKINFIKVRLYTFLLKKLSPRILYKLLIKEKYDIEISFFRGAAVKIISGSSNEQSKKLAWVHNDFTKCSGIFDWFSSEEKTINAYKKFDNIVCVSQYTKEKFIERMGISENVFVRYNINLVNDIIKKSSEDINESFKENRFKVCTVGRLVEAKGYDRLLNVHKRLIDEGITHELIIVGNGSEYDKYKTFIEDNGLEDTVHLLGNRMNPYKYINKSDLFVCSSRWEGFSTVISEAVILNKPILTTRVSGVSELFLDNEYEVIVDNDEESLYKGLKLLITNKELLNHYKEKVIERSKFFNTEKAVKNIETLF